MLFRSMYIQCDAWLLVMSYQPILREFLDICGLDSLGEVGKQKGMQNFWKAPISQGGIPL